MSVPDKYLSRKMNKKIQRKKEALNEKKLKLKGKLLLLVNSLQNLLKLFKLLFFIEVINDEKPKKVTQVNGAGKRPHTEDGSVKSKNFIISTTWCLIGYNYLSTGVFYKCFYIL